MEVVEVEETLHTKKKEVPQSFIELANRLAVKRNAQKQKKLIIGFVKICGEHVPQSVEKIDLIRGEFLTFFDKSSG